MLMVILSQCEDELVCVHFHGAGKYDNEQVWFSFFLEEAEAVYAMHVQFLHEKQL